ncbi:MAG: DUF4178 domain-containing protein [Cyanobacteria bacterium J06554_3]
MENLFWLLIIAVLVGMAIWYFKGGGSKSSAPGTRQPTLFTLQLGDVVQYDNIDWIIEDKLTYNDDGWEWVEYLIQDGDRIGFLSVDDDDTLEVSITETVKDIQVDNPPAGQITYRQQVYNQDEKGTAKLKRARHPERAAETCQYFDYTGPGDAVMAVEIWSGQTEVSVGQSVRPYQLTFLPGDGQSVYRSEA